MTRAPGGQVVRHGAIVFAGVGLASFFNYLFFMLIGRATDVETYGIVASLASALYLVAAPATVAQFIFARIAADLEATGNRAEMRKLSDTATRGSLGVAIIVVLCCVAGRDSVGSFFHVRESATIIVASFALGLLVVVTVQRGVLQGSHNFAELAISMIIESIIKVVVGVPLVSRFGATGAIAGIVVGLALAYLFNEFAHRRLFGSERAAIELVPATAVRVMAHVGLTQLVFTVLMFYDVPLIRHIFDARLSGLYAAAALIGRAVLAANSFVPIVLMPKASSRFSAGRSPLPLLYAAVLVSVVMSGTAVVATWIAPELVIRIIAGRQFVGAAPFALPYVAASGALALASVVAAYKMGLHQYRFVIVAGIAALAEVAILSVWHPNLPAVVVVLFFGHVAVLVSTWLPPESKKNLTALVNA